MTNMHFDPGQVEQIIVNLAVNARDAMPNGGRLDDRDLQVVGIDDEYAATHFDARHGAYVLLSVSDTGSGMNEEVREHLFEPFFTTKGLGQGYGPRAGDGVRRRSAGTVGRIDVSTELESGNDVKIYLPAGQGRSAAAVSSLGRHRRDAQRRGRFWWRTTRACASWQNTTLTRGWDTRSTRSRAAGRCPARARRCSAPAPELPDHRRHHAKGIGNGRVLAERAAALLQTSSRVLFVSGYTEDLIVDRGVLKAGIELLAKPYSHRTAHAARAEVLDDVAGRVGDRAGAPGRGACLTRARGPPRPCPKRRRVDREAVEGLVRGLGHNRLDDLPARGSSESRP